MKFHQVWVANPTQQVHQLFYRIKNKHAPVTQLIPQGGQVRLSKELEEEELVAFIVQQSNYGMVSWDEVDRTKPFIGLCYSVGKPVPIGVIRGGLMHNQEILIERGTRLRQEAGVAVHNMIEQTDFMRETGSDLKSLELSVVEENQDRHTQIVPDTPIISEGVRVTKDVQKAPPPKGSRRRAA
jgi:hypothetical protein